MKLVCAWCNIHMGQKHSDIHPEDAITHGICDECMLKLYKKKQIDFIPFLNTISAPVVLIDENNTYIAANDKALVKLGKEHSSFQSKRTGDIFSCQNAHLAGGCGHTKKCGGCQMLNLITETYEGKHSFSHVPVNLIQKDNNSTQEINLKITTENINGMVLMRIDDMKP